MDEEILKYRQTAWASAYAIGRNAADADDAAQEACLALLKRAQRTDVSPIEHIEAWIKTVAKWQLWGGYRERYKMVTDSLEGLATEDNEYPASLNTPARIDQALITADLVHKALEVLAEMPSNEREMVLQYAAGWNFRQIAAASGLDYFVARQRVLKAIQKTRKRMNLPIRKG